MLKQFEEGDLSLPNGSFISQSEGILISNSMLEILSKIEGLQELIN
jgi:hypothetical protein